MADLDSDLSARVGSYLRLADRLLPDWIIGFYLVGSAALDEYRPGRSDVDFVAVVTKRLAQEGLRRLRLLHLLAGVGSAWRSARRGMSPFAGTVNGVFVCGEDLQLPVTCIRPVASHVASSFMVGRGFDVNPVVWKVLAEKSIAVRGAPAGSLGLDPEPGVLRDWNLRNLNSYWSSWGRSTASLGLSARAAMAIPRTRMRTVAWGVLGAPRLHCTIATGEIIGKAAAGEYALATFGRQWHPLVTAALAYWQGNSLGSLPRVAAERAGAFVLEVVDSANKLPTPRRF